MATAAVTLLIFSITRVAHGDWRRSLVCLAIGIILFILFSHQARQYRAEIKIRANEYARTHPRIVEQKAKTETEGPPNQVLEATSESAPKASSSSPQD